MKIVILLLIYFSRGLFAAENDACRTPDDKDGTCIRFRNCQVLFGINRKIPENAELIRQSQCGTSDDNKPLVCCPKAIVFQPPVGTVGSCTTPNNLDGTCKVFKNCSVLFDLIKQKPVSAENQKLIQDSQCRGAEDKKIYVCCPDLAAPGHSPTTVIPSPINKPCIDPNNDEGTCIKYKTCSHMFAMSKKGTVSSETLHFIKQSVCATEDNKIYVCCAPEKVTERPTVTPAVRPTNLPVPASTTSTTTTTTTTTETPNNGPEWMKKLKLKTPECMLAGDTDRIIGGTPTEYDEYPWLALIEYTKPEKGFHCGGSLISDRYVLTAAHCLKKIPKTWELTSVRLGEWNISKEIDCSPDNPTLCAPPPLDIRVVKKTEHPSYRKATRNQHFDIALLRLAKKVEPNNFVKPICLPLDQALWEANFVWEDSFTASGWGKTEVENKSAVKLKVSLPHVSNEGCSRIYAPQGREIKDHQEKTLGKYAKYSGPGLDGLGWSVTRDRVTYSGIYHLTDVLFYIKFKKCSSGDSGGPLMALTNDDFPSVYLAGIVSYGPAECGLENVPAVYTRVSSYLEWISDNIQD